MKMFASPYGVEMQEKHWFQPLRQWCFVHVTPKDAIIQALHKASFCFSPCPTRLWRLSWMAFSSAHTFELASALLIFHSLWPECPPALSELWPQVHVLSRDDCLRWMEAGEGSPETKGKKTDEKAFSFIYFSKNFDCQMHLLFPEVIILSSFLYDLAATLGGGSNLFLALLF